MHISLLLCYFVWLVLLSCKHRLAEEAYLERNDRRGSSVQSLQERSNTINTTCQHCRRAVDTLCNLRERREIAAQAPLITIECALRSLCAPAAINGVVGYLTSLLRRPYGDPTALLSEGRVLYQHVQSARRRPAFYMIHQRSLAMP